MQVGGKSCPDYLCLSFQIFNIKYNNLICNLNLTQMMSIPIFKITTLYIKAKQIIKREYFL